MQVCIKTFTELEHSQHACITFHPLYWKCTSTWTLKTDQSLSVNAFYCRITERLPVSLQWYFRSVRKSSVVHDEIVLDTTDRHNFITRNKNATQNRAIQ